jgi:hypothetical protein
MGLSIGHAICATSWAFLISAISETILNRKNNYRFQDDSILLPQNNTTHISEEHRKIDPGTANFAKPQELRLANLTDRMSKKWILAPIAAYASITDFKKSTSGIQGTSFTHIPSTSFKLRKICNYVLTECKVMNFNK